MIDLDELERKVEATLVGIENVISETEATLRAQHIPPPVAQYPNGQFIMADLYAQKAQMLTALVDVKKLRSEL